MSDLTETNNDVCMTSNRDTLGREILIYFKTGLRYHPI